MKNKIKEVDKQIEVWQNLVKQYPLSENYKNILYRLQQYRVDLVSKIGIK